MCVYGYIMYKGVLYTLKNQGKEDKLISLKKSRKSGDECIKHIKLDSRLMSNFFCHMCKRWEMVI